MNKIAKRYMRLALAALLVGGAGANATTLSPQQALSRALSGTPGMFRAPAAEMNLVFTGQGETAPTLYIFNSNHDNGFLIVSASDLAIPVLGYSDSGNIDVTDLPPAFEWWLSEYSRQIEWAESVGLQPAEAPAPIAENRKTIYALVRTSWDQSAPYNNSCPTIGYTQGKTGCVATAMAQVMKYYQHPICGIGTKSYSYNTTSGTINVNVKFSSINYDWTNMERVYGTVYTSAQAKAVADLMFHAGAAVESVYTANSTSASPMSIAPALYDVFDYDRGMKTVFRDSYNNADWDNLMYTEMSEGRPVIYNATTKNNYGHAFVCDGYDGSSKYHINWGWAGKSDGFYALSALSPSSLGTGGSSGGYNYNHIAIVGIKKPTSNKPNPYGEFLGKFASTSTSYSRMATVYFTSSEGGTNQGFFYLGCYPVNITMGIVLVDNEGTARYVNGTNSDTFNGGAGVQQIGIPAYSLPTGTFLVYPGIGYNSTGSKLQWNRETNSPLLMTVSSSGVTISSTASSDKVAAMPLMIKTNGQVATLSQFLGGESYNISSMIRTSTDAQLSTKLVLKNSRNQTIAESDELTADMLGHNYSKASWTLDIPRDAATDTGCKLYIYYKLNDGSWQTTTAMTYSAAVTGTTPTVVPGDVNGDNNFTITDISMAVAYAFDDKPSNGIKEAADVNGDGEVTITDVAIIIGKVISASRMQMPADMMRMNAARAETATLSEGILSVSNATEYCGVQFDITSADDLSEDAVMCIDSRFKTVAGRVDANTLRVVAYSVDNTNFISDRLFEVIGASDDLTVSNVILTHRDGNYYEDVRAFSPAVETAITGIGAEEPCEVYDLSGKLIYTGTYQGFIPGRGIFIVKTPLRTIPIIR